MTDSVGRMSLVEFHMVSRHGIPAGNNAIICHCMYAVPDHVHTQRTLILRGDIPCDTGSVWHDFPSPLAAGGDTRRTLETTTP